jgi:hypothetical protein
MSIKSEIQESIVVKALSKKDGVYTLQGVQYRVRDNMATHYAAYGQLLKASKKGNTVVGTYDWSWLGTAGTKMLKAIK